MVELPPTSFTFGNYNADIPFGVYVDYDKLLRWMKENNVVGYSKTTSFKDRSDHTAVLFNLEEHGEYWSHIPDELFELYKKSISQNN